MKNPHQIFVFFLLLFVTSAQAQQVDTEYDNQKKSILKMEFFSPLTGHTTFGYERYIKDWVSWEAKVGFIGIGVEPQLYDGSGTNPSGLLLRGGPKFKLNPDFVTRDLRGSHLLSGKYIKPEIVASFYSEYELVYNGSRDVRVRDSFSSVAILINYGRQYVLADIFSVDYHIGVGYGFDNIKNDTEAKHHHSHFLGHSDFPVALSIGFTIGVLLK